MNDGPTLLLVTALAGALWLVAMGVSRYLVFFVM
jgi:hypothetical protein